MRLLAPLLAVALAAPLLASDNFAQQRARMIRAIEADVAMTAREIGTDRLDRRVMSAIASIPRHEFVPPAQQRLAYENRPLPIGHGQTISQPYIVALMTHLLGAGKDDTVLEIGTGSGYQAAVLSPLVRSVHTIEIVEPLARTAAARLRSLGYANVTVRHGDGYHGWASDARYDAIIVTAAASHVPPPLIEQLKPGGRMVIPVGRPFTTQQLLVIDKSKSGKITTRQILPVVFVPLTGDH
jgi:protein-L-isoaspartate(D-aspartate) O-methyltransferase